MNKTKLDGVVESRLTGIEGCVGVESGPSPMATEKERVCVTGAGGFMASWVVNYLLSKDFEVHGTLREPSDPKNAHLKKLHKASENLKLFKAELLDYNSLYSAIKGCKGVFHVASPVPSPSNPSSNPEVEVVEPAVKGTRNMLKACIEAKVKRVAIVSSLVALTINPSWPKGQVIDESCWSDKDYCRTTNKWYCLGKTEAESEAFEFGKRNGLDVVTLCPTVIFGPILQSTVNSSTLLLVNLLKGNESLENIVRPIVDVRDAAEALILLYMKPGAQGRYLCNSHVASDKDIVEKLKTTYPNYNYPKNFTEGGKYYIYREDMILTSAKLQSLGWKYRSLEETLVDSVESYKNAGILD